MPKEPRRPVLTDENQDDEEYLEHYHNDQYDVDMWYLPHRTFELADRITAAIDQYKGNENVAQLQAIITACVVTWNVTIPAHFKTKDKHGMKVTHPRAGKTAPITLEWVRKLPESVVIDAAVTIANHFAEAGRSAEEQEKFRGEDTPGDVSEDRDVSERAGDGQSGEGEPPAAA